MFEMDVELFVAIELLLLLPPPGTDDIGVGVVEAEDG